MNNYEKFEQEQCLVNRLDFHGHDLTSSVMFRQYQRRNAFGLDQSKKIHRIFQEEYLEKDISDGYLTLPNASASIWNDPLENPLSEVEDIDLVTGGTIKLGNLVKSFHALCWTQRNQAQPSDWTSFSHGNKAVRVTTSVGKLMNRIMDIEDSSYMHRAWLIQVNYMDPTLIKMMQNPTEVYNRMDSQGALLALSAAVVRSQYSKEDEIRLLFDAAMKPSLKGLIRSQTPSLIRIPFDWKDFIENKEDGPGSVAPN